MKAIIIMMMVGLWATPCMSGSLNLLMGSKHFTKLDDELNEENPGLVLNMNRGSMIYGVGAYINSYNKNTVFTHLGMKNKWFNVKAMLLTGYKTDVSCNQSVCLGLAFGVELNRVNIEYIPGHTTNTLAMHLRLLDF